MFDAEDEFAIEYKDIISPEEIHKWHQDLIEIDILNKSTLEKKEYLLDVFVFLFNLTNISW